MGEFLLYKIFYFSLQKLRGYQGEDIELRLPDDLTVFDIDWFALYCIKFTQNFGHIMLKVDLNIPADLKMLRSGTKKVCLIFHSKMYFNL